MDLQGLPVLLVEDEPDSRELLSVVLELCGSRVAAAASVDEALHRLDAAAPAVIVSDLSMPGKDGFQLLRALRNAGNHAPAVAVTGHAYERDRALAAGFAVFLTKPVEPDVLCSTVAALAPRS